MATLTSIYSKAGRRGKNCLGLNCLQLHSKEFVAKEFLPRRRGTNSLFWISFVLRHGRADERDAGHAVLLLAVQPRSPRFVGVACPCSRSEKTLSIHRPLHFNARVREPRGSFCSGVARHMPPGPCNKRVPLGLRRRQLGSTNTASADGESRPGRPR